MLKKRILLTGGRGMVGRNLLEHPAIGQFDLLMPDSKELDLRNYIAVETYIKKYQPEMIIHAAGKVGGIQANIREPVNFFLENLDMGRNIVLASYRSGIRQLINLGSSCMYPKNSSESLSEDMILKGELEPTNEGYAIAKIATAKLCDFIRREDSSYIYKTIIPCNLYGRYDKFDPTQSHLIPAVIHKIHQAKIKNENFVEIWGDGFARREFMYAGDLTGMIVKAIDDFDSLPFYTNVGLGYDYTVNEYYQAVAEVIGFSGKFIHDISKPVGMRRKLVNIDRQLHWGWKYQIDLKQGLKKTYEYYLSEVLKNEL
jgi:GDP-L-fucose synthase